jgi:hypothetical protein
LRRHFLSPKFRLFGEKWTFSKASGVHCEWDGSRLILQADNDFDSNGIALLDEFSDAISASLTDGFDGDIDVVSVN